ncbi:hypothetical protein [Nonomuraea sp. NPDC049646]|uniref:hypothetical protein n=1 Tax=unclassified Nonomuraea TaxID=2593643 RepID=UPI0037BBF330
MQGRLAEIIRAGRDAATVAETHRTIWVDTVRDVAEGCSALLVGHGGAIELALAACFPDASHDSWGTPFAHCDGARLGFADGRFVSIEFHRAPQSPIQPS